MQATFRFKMVGRGVEGRVKVDFNFQEYQKDKSYKAPLEINLLSALEIDSNYLTIAQKELVKKDLLSQFENLKANIFKNNFSKP